MLICELALVVVAALCGAAEDAARNQSESSVAQLVAQLDHADFSVREQAEAALVDRGAAALDELRQYYDDDSPEIRFRVRQIVTRVESARFAGRWQLVRWESAGKTKEGRENIIEIEGRAWRSQADVFSYSLNPLANPAEIDWHLAGGTWCGIYRFDGDLMILALRAPGEGRPSVFATTLADTTTLHTRQRMSEP